MTATVISIYGINKIISITSVLKKLLKTEHGRYYEWKYGNIFYTKTGSGSPLLLIHDLNPSSSSVEWEKVVTSLSKKHTVYTLDLLGCGRSDKPNLTYTNYLYVQLITDFIKNIICEKTDIIATRSSASFTIMGCNMNPKYFDKLIIINPENLNDLAKIPSKQKNILKYLIDFPIIGTLIYNILFSQKSVESILSREYFHQQNLIPSKLVDTYYESAHIGNSRGKYLLSSMESHYTNINIVHALKKINHSIYLICSKNNEDAEAIADSYCYYNPAIETAAISNTKLLPQLETPEEFVKQVDIFLGTK